MSIGKPSNNEEFKTTWEKIEEILAQASAEIIASAKIEAEIDLENFKQEDKKIIEDSKLRRINEIKETYIRAMKAAEEWKRDCPNDEEAYNSMIGSAQKRYMQQMNSLLN